MYFVSERKIPPTFTKKPSEHIEDAEGKLVKLESRVSGSQPLSVSWYKDNREINTSDIYDISFISNTAVMCLKNATVTDSGIYTCSTSNDAGTASFRVVINITGRQYCLTAWLSYFSLVIFLFLICMLISGNSVMCIKCGFLLYWINMTSPTFHWKAQVKMLTLFTF